MNILVEPVLQLSDSETYRVLNRREFRVFQAVDLFQRVAYPYLKPEDSKKGSRKNAIHGFSDARDE